MRNIQMIDNLNSMRAQTVLIQIYNRSKTVSMLNLVICRKILNRVRSIIAFSMLKVIEKMSVVKKSVHWLSKINCRKILKTKDNY